MTAEAAKVAKVAAAKAERIKARLSAQLAEAQRAATQASQAAAAAQSVAERAQRRAAAGQRVSGMQARDRSMAARRSSQREHQRSCTDDMTTALPNRSSPLSARSNDSSCSAWTSELEAAGVISPQQPLDWRLKRKLDHLVTHWLRPFENGIWPENLRTHAPKNRTHVENYGLGEGRHCPLVSVVAGRVYIEIPEDTRFWTLSLSKCSRSSEGGRQLTVLRLLFIALRVRQLPDFQFRLCSDDYCHGLFEAGGTHKRSSVPLFASVSCETHRTLPAVQWNTLSSRDPDFGQWDAALSDMRLQRQSLDRLWECREPKAVWRGAIADNHVYNVRWTWRGQLAQEQVVGANWQKAGRMALAFQKCQHPDLLDVRFKLLRSKQVDANCTNIASKDKPKSMSMSEQARRFRYMVHVEGIAGWADRLRHVLLSGATALKQEVGVREWYEPLLEPWKHYVPVASTLWNLSHAVRWARTHDVEARRIAANAASLIDGVLSEAAVTYYQVELFSKYAALWRGATALQRPVSRSLAQLNCSVERRGELWDTECALLNPDTGEDSWVPPGERRRRFENMKHLWLARGDASRPAPPRPHEQMSLGLASESEFRRL